MRQKAPLLFAFGLILLFFVLPESTEKIWNTSWSPNDLRTTIFLTGIALLFCLFLKKTGSSNK